MLNACLFEKVIVPERPTQYRVVKDYVYMYRYTCNIEKTFLKIGFLLQEFQEILK